MVDQLPRVKAILSHHAPIGRQMQSSLASQGVRMVPIICLAWHVSQMLRLSVLRRFKALCPSGLLLVARKTALEAHG